MVVPPYFSHSFPIFSSHIGPFKKPLEALDEGPYREWLEPDVSQSLRFGIEVRCQGRAGILWSATSFQSEMWMIFVEKTWQCVKTNSTPGEPQNSW